MKGERSFACPQLAARAAAVGVTRVLAKPLQRGELAQALDQLLSGAKTG